MPSYKTRRRADKPAKKKARRYPKRLPRDVTKRLSWAARGTVKDYARLRELAKKARESLPAHIDRAAFDRLLSVDRLTMIEEIQAAEEHNISAGWFLDSVNWVLDKVPFGNWMWPVAAAQSSINSLKGDGLNEVDEQYARLVGATYGGVDERPFVIDHWKRQVQFDSSYISVWDNPDGHRLITVRGTQGSGKDWGEDLLGSPGFPGLMLLGGLAAALGVALIGAADAVSGFLGQADFTGVDLATAGYPDSGTGALNAVSTLGAAAFLIAGLIWMVAGVRHLAADPVGAG